MENQKDVWNSVAVPWKSFRVNPIPEVVDFLKDKKGKILDLGCGAGRHILSNQNIDFCGVDFSDEMIKFAKENAEKKEIVANFFVANSDELPFRDNFFDAAICVAVLHCIPDEKKRRKSLEELFRVLKPNAEAWLSVWDKNQEKFIECKKDVIIPWKHKGKEYMRYYYLYDTKEFADLLKKAGFEILKINNSENPNGFDSKRNIDIIVRKPS